MYSPMGRQSRHKPKPKTVKSSTAKMRRKQIRQLATALARAGKDSSFPWENPDTGAGGNITPLATSYTEGGLSCRDFLASYVHGGSQDWLQGAACRTEAGAWEIRRLKPLGSG